MSPSIFSFSTDLAACFLLGVPDTACLSLEDADPVVFARFLFFSFVSVSSSSFSSVSSPSDCSLSDLGSVYFFLF